LNTEESGKNTGGLLAGGKEYIMKLKKRRMKKKWKMKKERKTIISGIP